MPWYIIIQIIAVTIQLVFLTGTIYSGTQKGKKRIGEDKVSHFREVCFYGNMICMAIVLLMNAFVFKLL